MQDRDLSALMKIYRRNFYIWQTIVSIVAFLGFFVPVATANVPTPRLKPPVPNFSSYLSASDGKLFRAGLRAAENKQWTRVTSYRTKLGDSTARDILTWIQAYRDPKISLSELTYTTQNLGDWPRMTAIRAKAEARLFDKPLSASRTIDWFQGRDPVSGEGRAALAHAYYQTGNQVLGDKWLKLAWTESKLTRDRQRTIFGRYKNKLTRDDHAARADHLIWEGRAHFSKANALLPHMAPADRALMDARMRVAGNRSGMDRAINAVPKTLRSDAGLLYERARWRRRKKTKEYALPVFLQLQSPPISKRGQERVWREKKIMAYWAIQEKRYKDAYNLTVNHGMVKGSGFAEAEFLAGWLALKKLGNASLALPHFQRLKDGVTYPVSLSRADYWLGRTYEKMGDGQYHSAYAEAARFSNTFYGFLAAERAGNGSSLVSLPYESDPSHLRLGFQSDPRIRAMNLLGEAREEHYFNVFAFHMDDTVETLEHLSLLSGLGAKYQYMKPSVRAAKQASRFQSMLTESGYPMPDSIVSLPSKFDIPFVLSIARQESEFNPKAVSSARAYGLMQMINSTARATARKHRVPYSRSRLTSDVHYSANLGALHLQDLLDDFEGSYILAAVAYNAGPHRARQWIKAYGDPRGGNIDPLDWLESIPFSETRNYVQRVMENMQVYRARMNGNVAQNRVLKDITSGAF